MRIPGELIPIVLFTVGPITLILYPLARAMARKIERSAAEPRELPDAVAARLERMEQAIDSIAIEVERISEGQRFTTRLLSDRGAGPAPGGGGAGSEGNGTAAGRNGYLPSSTPSGGTRDVG